MSNKICDIEKRIFDYKLKEIHAWRNPTFIIEVKGKPVCMKKNETMILTNDPFPTEYTFVQVCEVKKKITGDEPKIYTVREWYREKLQLLTRLMLSI